MCSLVFYSGNMKKIEKKNKIRKYAKKKLGQKILTKEAYEKEHIISLYFSY